MKRRWDAYPRTAEKGFGRLGFGRRVEDVLDDLDNLAEEEPCDLTDDAGCCRWLGVERKRDGANDALREVEHDVELVEVAQPNGGLVELDELPPVNLLEGVKLGCRGPDQRLRRGDEGSGDEPLRRKTSAFVETRPSSSIL